jgi:2-amino-4-hydroxy-6-hydroxymethyldihydropteridine diphosphokinase / dihydropteroate synthase
MWLTPSSVLSHERLPPDFNEAASGRSMSRLLDEIPKVDDTMSPVVSLSPKLPLRRVLDPCRETLIMAILNITPDSFSDGGRHRAGDLASIQETVLRMVHDGAAIIDVGGQSTRPYAELIGPKEELDRVLPVIRAIRGVSDIAISIDTFHSEVARQAVRAGADIINDISAGVLDPEMLPTVAELGKSIILMHTRGDPQTMTKLTDYPDGLFSTKGVPGELEQRVRAAEQAGIHPWRIILDPGLGFAKNQDQNLELLRKMGQLRQGQPLQRYPWLVGPSRKGFVGNITGVSEASARTFGTAAAVTASIAGGADIVRVHDVAEMVQVAKMADAIYRRP